jgi:hypothetical protein
VKSQSPAFKEHRHPERCDGRASVSVRLGFFCSQAESCLREHRQQAILDGWARGAPPQGSACRSAANMCRCAPYSFGWIEMRLLTTGGCGFIGAAVIRHLIRDTDHSVINVDTITYAARPRTRWRLPGRATAISSSAPISRMSGRWPRSSPRISQISTAPRPFSSLPSPAAPGPIPTPAEADLGVASQQHQFNLNLGKCCNAKR